MSLAPNCLSCLSDLRKLQEIPEDAAAGWCDLGGERNLQTSEPRGGDSRSAEEEVLLSSEEEPSHQVREVWGPEAQEAEEVAGEGAKEES